MSSDPVGVETDSTFLCELQTFGKTHAVWILIGASGIRLAFPTTAMLPGHLYNITEWVSAHIIPISSEPAGRIDLPFGS